MTRMPFSNVPTYFGDFNHAKDFHPLSRCTPKNCREKCELAKFYVFWCLGRGLLYCMEYMEEHLDDWLGQELQVIHKL